MRRIKRFILAVIIFMTVYPSIGRAALPFNPITDIDYGELDYRITGICICVHRWSISIGVIFEYWEPFALIDTSHEAYYSATIGTSVGSMPSLNGDNNSQTGSSPNDENFAQAHAFLITIIPNFICRRRDWGTWWTEVDSTWQTDSLSILLTPEAALVANFASQMACSADAIGANAGHSVDSLYWCVGSGGSTFPVTGHVHADDIIQANSTAAARLIFKLSRQRMICDTVPRCGCRRYMTWIKSHYKMAAVRPSVRDVYSIGRSAVTYGAGLDAPMVGGSYGPQDEFLWVVYRKQVCCTCCE